MRQRCFFGWGMEGCKDFLRNFAQTMSALRTLWILTFLALAFVRAESQVATDRVMAVGQNALFFEDYVLSIHYFNRVIGAKPYLARPYLLRAIAKLNLDDYTGAERDATEALDRNPFLADAYEVRGVARQNMDRYPEAVADYDQALATYPDNRNLLYNKSQAQISMKDYAGADSTFEQLTRNYPRFDAGLTGRARLRLLQGDTIAALTDIEKALELNPDGVNAYILRADIRTTSSTPDLDGALTDIDRAIKLHPLEPGLLINRAFIRYKNDDLRGAMDDYDHALGLDPSNATALYNRALLRAEVHDLNRAIDDLTAAMNLGAGQGVAAYRMLFNRAILYNEIGDLKGALADLDKLVDAFPDFSAAIFLRGDVKQKMGDQHGAKRDHDHSIALATRKDVDPDKNPLMSDTSADSENDADAPRADETPEEARQRFSELVNLTAATETLTDESHFNTPGIKGRVQDRRTAIELQPEFELTYYLSPTEIKLSADYLREVQEVNDTGALRRMLQISNLPRPEIDSSVLDDHQLSIEAFTARLSRPNPRPVDWFGRAMDYMTLRDYEAALADLDRAIMAAPDFALAFLARATARIHLAEVEPTNPSADRRLVLADLDRTIQLRPSMAVAHYNRGTQLARANDFQGAADAFSRAIELNPGFGEAYFNRGFVELSLGHRKAGIADMSRAGELGIVSAYTILKRL